MRIEVVNIILGDEAEWTGGASDHCVEGVAEYRTVTENELVSERLGDGGGGRELTRGNRGIEFGLMDRPVLLRGEARDDRSL